MSLVKVKRIENSLKCKALENKETIVNNGDGDCYPIKPGLRFEVIHCIYCKCILSTMYISVAYIPARIFTSYQIQLPWLFNTLMDRPGLDLNQ